MALLTLLAVSATVYIVKPMAGETIAWGLRIAIILMAAGADGFLVLAGNFKFGFFIMIKPDLCPVFLNVANGTFFFIFA